MANRPLAPKPLVTMVPSVSVVLPDAVASRPALSPYWLLLSALEEAPVVVIVGLTRVSTPELVTQTADWSVALAV